MAAWPGSNGPVLFAGGTAGGPTGIWSREIGRNPLRQVSAGDVDTDPQVSPDGRWLVFVRQAEAQMPSGSGQVSAFHIYRARIDGTDLTRVTDGAVFDDDPAFAPSGQRIVFSRSLPGDPRADIYSVRLDGANLHRLTSGDADDRNPAFSPNRRVIAFDRAETEDVPRHVHTMRPDGSAVVDATPGLGYTAEPEFNRAGSRIAFIRGQPAVTRADLFAMRPDGERLRRLTGMRERRSGAFSSPSYSPDGRSLIAVFAVEGGFSRLQVIGLRDRGWGQTIGGRRQARAPDAAFPAWAAGGG